MVNTNAETMNLFVNLASVMDDETYYNFACFFDGLVYNGGVPGEIERQLMEWANNA